MYDKKTFILKQISPRFASYGRSLSAVVKLLDDGKVVHGSLCARNANVQGYGSWHFCAENNGELSLFDVDNLEQCVFELKSPLKNPFLLLIKREERYYAAAYASSASHSYSRLLDFLNNPKKEVSANAENGREEEATQYEEFLQRTDNYYALGDYKNALDDFYLNNKSTFFESVKEQLQKLYETYPTYTLLSRFIPDSYWIEIRRNEKFFALGIINKDSKPLCICYAVPKEKNPSSTEDFYIVKQDVSHGGLFL